MNISEFTALDRESQLAEAGRIANVDPKVFDGMWRTESGRGQYMLSPAGAEGHFGLMPKTRKTMEGRFGTTIDPNDFGQSLFTSAHLMAENMRAFKNVPDALRAYNGGWNRANWGNAETSAYVGKVLGDDTDAFVPTASNPVAPVLAQRSAAELWDVPFAQVQKAPKERTAGAEASAKLIASMQQVPMTPEQTPPSFETADATLKATADAQVKAQQEKDATSFLDMSKAMAFSTTPVQLLISLNRDAEPADPNFKVDEQMLAGRNLEQQADLSLARSQKEFDRIKFDQDYQVEQDRIANIHGAGWALAAGLFASLPEGVAFGGAATLALKGAGVGSVALARAGNKAGAILSSAGEGVLGNVLNTAALDMLGKRQGVNAYVLGATLGLVNPMLSGRYLGRLADKTLEFNEAKRLMDVAVAKEEKWLTRATAELGENADPELVRAKMDQYEAEEIRANTASHRQAVPESRKMVAGDPDAIEANAKETANPVDLEAAAASDEALTARAEANPDVNEPWNDPNFQQRRIDLVQTNETWARDFQKLSGGLDYATAKTLPAGVSLSPEVARLADTMPQLRNAIQALESLAKEYMPGQRIIFNNSLTDQGLKDGANGMIISAGDVHAIGLNAEKLKASPTQAMHTVYHELGHAIYHANAPLAPKEVLAAIDTEWKAFVDKVGKGDVSAREDRLAVTHPGRFDEKPIAINKYALKKDEYLAEQFVQHLQNRLLSGKHGNLPPKVIDQVIQGVKNVLGYILDLVKLGKIKPGKATDKFFSDILEGAYKARQQGEQFLAPDLRIPGEAAAADRTVYRGLTKPWDEARREDVEFWAPSRKHAETYAGPDGHVVQTKPNLKNPRVVDEQAYNRDAIESAYSDSSVDGMIVTRDGHPIIYATFNKPEVKVPKNTEDLRLPDMAAMSSSIDPAQAKVAKEVEQFLLDPVVTRHGLDRLPMGTPNERAEAKMIRDLYAKAESPEYVVDEKRLNSILKAFPSLNPTSNIMLRSKNPVVRMAAIELLENGGGAAGRRSTASIAKYQNERAIIGNSIVEMDRSFKAWFAGQDNKGAMSEFFTGQKRAEFNRLIAEEIEQRRQTGPKTDYGDFVRSAADTMENAFERSRLMQVDAKTAGWGALPESSVGYIPHRIKSNVYRTLTLEQKRALHAELVDQFITVSKFDPSFSDQLASRYLDRAEQRALGGFDMPMGMHQTGAPDMIREAMEQMGMTRPEIDSMMRRHIAGAANHTKKRLNIDLSKEVTLADGSTFNLMDIYDTDMLSLLRGQAQRVSGEVALARHGVLGKPGLTVMRRAMGYGGDGEQAVLHEVEAFDQVGAEFLGQPFGMTNKWVDRAVQFNSVSSLGGMGFNQLGEQINVAATLGVKNALSIVPEFARLRAEILKSVRTGKANNELLQYVETMGGAEFGTDAYKMVFPLDNPDLFQNSLGPDSINAGDKLLRGAGHVQSKLSLWRSIHSVQVRATAEQIVMKAGLAMREGKADFHLRDMGISDDVLERLRPDMQHIVHIRNGRVIKFDITKATDKEAAHQLIQGIHRGASQIIQGTFIGETGKYVHNSWLRLLTQFRNFSLTAIDKQWNRQVGNRGVGGAVVLTLAAMSAAAPIYMIRTYLAALGRDDKQEYLDKHLTPGAIARATTNYIATSGMAGDFMDAVTAVTGTGTMTGGRSGTATTLTGNLIAPAAGKIDKLWGAVQNTKDGTDPHALIKELPLSRLPFLIPAINALGD